MRSRLLLPILCSLLLAACGGDGSSSRSTRTKGLSEPETWTWGDVPIRFAPPTGDWERHRWQQGGLEGVSFQIRRAPAGRILVADYRSLYRKHSRTGSNSGRVEFEPAPPNASIDEVVDRVRFDPRSMPGPREAICTELEAREVGGQRALTLDYTWNDERDDFFGREVYVMANGSLFVLTLLGKESDVKLFERVVDSVQFPEPGTTP